MSVIVDKCADNEVFSTLKKLNVNYFTSCSLDFLYTPVNTHPDMQIHFIDKKTAVVAPSAYPHYKNILPGSITLIKGNCDPGSTYPHDCAYNVAKLGKKIIGNLSYTDTKIKDLYSQKGYEFIDVKQGYTKCNLCIIDENSVITEDVGLFKQLTRKNINVLKINAGFVELKDFNNGFIGGATGFVANKNLAFCGNLNEHPDRVKIENFINSKQVDITYLSSTNLKDFGSILYFDDNF